MNIDWEFIKEKYLKAYEKYCKFLWKDTNKRALSDSCYCDLVDFFDDNGIFIVIDNYSKKAWFFKINNGDKYIINHYNFFQYFKNRNEAQEQVIPKAFEILNEKL